MKLRIWVRNIIILVLLVMIGLIVLVSNTIRECNELITPPQIPTYANATQVAPSYGSLYPAREVHFLLLPSLLGNRGEIYTQGTNYAAKISSENLIEFYSQFGTCKIFNETGKISCHGMSDKEGEYFVNFDSQHEDVLKFTVEVWWKACPESIFN